MSKQLEIKILNQYWLGPAEEDLCSHGELFLRVGDTVISNEKDDEWNISESALSLLRSVRDNFPAGVGPNYYPEGFGEIEALIHHCGCFMLFCPSNIGWKVKHTEDTVELSNFTKNEGEIEYPNLKIKISLSEYAKEIYHFAVQAKALFSGQAKRTENNELFKGQYQLFWKEYDELLDYVRSKVS